ncbi:MAG TPA: glycerol-3-phosphate acyltransferase [candidate division Zixibacteria bacterium]|nr:glycerol-3-phosphate acyltransferase [candidate division Zixibacteria bacterium]
MIYPYFIAVIMGFILGSLPFAWIIVKLVTGKDVRNEGSGSVSTRNTVRTAGYGWAILTASLDVTKGFIGGFLLLFVIFPSSTFTELAYPELLPALCGIAAFAGHCWMPWMRFKGGKGFAVLTGALICVNPWGILVWWLSLPLYLIIIRYSGISGIMATFSVATVFTFFYGFEATYWHEWSILVFGWGCTLLVILRMIPDFIGMRKGEIKRWKGIKVSQWMR